MVRGKKLVFILFTTCCAAALIAPLAAFGSSAEEDKRVRKSADVLREIMAIPEQSIPPAMFRGIHGIAVVPGMIKAGFVVGGRYGRGILAVRSDDGSWSNPCFIELAGGSVGLQLGAQSTDVILVFKTRRSIDGIVEGKFTLGANASVAAGPVGRQVGAETDAELKAEIYSYSRSRGLFAGLSMEGAVLQVDDEANEDYYGKVDVTGREILEGGVPATLDSARTFVELLSRYSSAAE